MKFIQDTFDFSIQEPCVISMGKFDGLHAGHKTLITEMMDGKMKGLKAVAITFNFSPKSSGMENHRVLTTLIEKEEVFERAGIDVMIELPFTEQLRNMNPYQFLKMITERINIKKIVVGTDFRFGHNRSGDYNTLTEYAYEFGYECCVVNKLKFQGEDISSTKIRHLIEDGKIEEANALLGYPYFLREEVVHGEGFGHTLDMPTINMIPSQEKLLPPNGVYVSTVSVKGQVYGAISNIGFKPTVGEFPLGVETHIFGFNNNLYGVYCNVAFYHYLRPELKFDDVEKLQEQIRSDIESCKKILRSISY